VEPTRTFSSEPTRNATPATLSKRLRKLKDIDTERAMEKLGRRERLGTRESHEREV